MIDDGTVKQKLQAMADLYDSMLQPLTACEEAERATLRHAANRIASLEAENERLSTDLKVALFGQGHLRDLKDNAQSMCEQLRAENARLREALSTIEKAPAWGYPDKFDIVPSGIRMLARDALEPAKEWRDNGTRAIADDAITGRRA
jgi:hypothetical protein